MDDNATETFPPGDGRTPFTEVTNPVAPADVNIGWPAMYPALPMLRSLAIVTLGVKFTDPVTVSDPEIVISYALIPVKASTDWETCPGVMTPRETIVLLSNTFAI